MWIKIDQEPLYQNQYKLLQYHETAYQLLVKVKAMMISLDRLKLAKLPENYEDND